jgi:hypothetical protein
MAEPHTMVKHINEVSWMKKKIKHKFGSAPDQDKEKKKK